MSRTYLKLARIVRALSAVADSCCLPLAAVVAVTVAVSRDQVSGPRRLILLAVPYPAGRLSRPPAIGVELAHSSPNPTAAEPRDGRFCQGRLRVYMNHASWPEAVALRSQTVLTGSGSPRYSYGGLGEATHISTRIPAARKANLTIPPPGSGATRAPARLFRPGAGCDGYSSSRQATPGSVPWIRRDRLSIGLRCHPGRGPVRLPRQIQGSGYRTLNLVIRRSRHICPRTVRCGPVCWADIPGLSARDRRFQRLGSSIGGSRPDHVPGVPLMAKGPVVQPGSVGPVLADTCLGGRSEQVNDQRGAADSTPCRPGWCR